MSAFAVGVIESMEKVAGAARVQAARKEDSERARAFAADLPKKIKGYTGPADIMRKHNVNSYDPQTGITWFKGKYAPKGKAWDEF